MKKKTATENSPPSSYPPLTPEGLADLCPVSRETLGRLIVYGELLVKWQRAINLVGGGSLKDLWRRHMLDSLQLTSPLATAWAARGAATPPVIVDLGSGAGFPGLVLAIAGAGQVHLVESDTRKAAFLREVARETGALVEVHDERIEALPPFTADFITARALAPLSKLLEYADPFLLDSSICLFLKGKAAEEELTCVRKEWNMQIERLPSLSDPTGLILKLENVSRKE
ncbi:MAG: 16S rRNA (guanine(527)-N(7))-methyltransferase RsmG [Rhodospirillaceae bacterium]|jgi:16S rRNA (guanine527-N7)-methyltransferase|nr:16S rRNA (guanine(527)-N(7))-methyltransferase RsmG [Rhodospirillaceae bacterium]MBT5373724.1 16S rRNA (guanine(527)-N(7))-methyltransferase RsmG [Rhodospirillaceae bacterium]MBT5658853.1 16S rRNA (guanine(527)-N(7))-methyltransferase RsmG [Rhodospirillaceae bacterium]MBT5751727.1 16S rRNA (guanine(527)-N(7))-methyltransferase RsmG [Rhodospirillaceae bacterium]